MSLIFSVINAWAVEVPFFFGKSCAFGDCLSCSNKICVSLKKIMVNSNSGKIFCYRTMGFAQYVLNGFLLAAFAKTVNETHNFFVLEYLLGGGFRREIT